MRDSSCCHAAHAFPSSLLRTAILKLTSGSTGAPKAALTSEAQLVGDGTQIAAAMGIRPADTQIAVIPLSHSYGLGVLLMPLLLQGTAIVLRDSFVPHQLPPTRGSSARGCFRRAVHVRVFHREPAARRWPPCLHAPDLGGRAADAGDRPRVSRSLRRQDSFVLRHDGNRRHRLRRQRRRSTTAATVGRPLPGVTITLQAATTTCRVRRGRVHVRSAAVAARLLRRDARRLRGRRLSDRRLRRVGRGAAADAARARLVVRERRRPESAARRSRAGAAAMPGVGDVRVLAAPDPRRGQQIVACIVADRGTARQRAERCATSAQRASRGAQDSAHRSSFSTRSR